MMVDEEVRVAIPSPSKDMDAITAAALSVRDELGAGLTEAIYRNGLALALKAMGHAVSMEVPVPVMYMNEVIGTLRADMVVDKNIVVELKCVAKITEAHVAQAQAYKTRITGARAVVLNFTLANGVENRQLV
jgi:GxxExxY protein